jgi:multiple sugar transport system ATP-binding protein
LQLQFDNDVEALITDLHQRLGTTTIYVTHDQIEAMTMGVWGCPDFA